MHSESLARAGILPRAGKTLEQLGCRALTDHVTYFKGGDSCFNCDPRAKPLDPLPCPIWAGDDGSGDVTTVGDSSDGGSNRDDSDQREEWDL